MGKHGGDQGGQPTKYRKSFHDADFIRLSKQGKTITQIALEWDVDRDSIYEWSRKHESFSCAIKKGRVYSEAWYMNIGQLAMLGEAKMGGKKMKVEVGFYVWLTKNLFKWTDKADLSEVMKTAIELNNASKTELLKVMEEEKEKINKTH